MANEITINTDWGEPGHQLTGAQVQAFIKGMLTDLSNGQTSNAQNIANLGEDLTSLASAMDTASTTIENQSRHIVTLEVDMEAAKGHINANRLAISALQAGMADTSSLSSENHDNIANLQNQIQTVSESELDNLVTRANFTAMMNQPACLYNVVSTDGCKTGTMVMFSDSMHHTVTQCLISFYFLDTIPGSGAHSQKIHIIWRCWSRDAVHGPMNSWSEWESLIPELTDNTGNDRNKPISQYGATKFFKSLCDKIHVPYTTDPTTGQITITD